MYSRRGGTGIVLSNRALSEGHNKCTMNLGDVRKKSYGCFLFLHSTGQRFHASNDEESSFILRCILPCTATAIDGNVDIKEELLPSADSRNHPHLQPLSAHQVINVKKG